MKGIKYISDKLSCSTYLYTCVIIPRTAVSSMARNGSLGQLTSILWSRWVADLCSLMYWGLVTNCYLFSNIFTTLLLKLDTLKESLTSFGKAFQFWTILLLKKFFLISHLGLFAQIFRGWLVFLVNLAGFSQTNLNQMSTFTSSIPLMILNV